MELKKLAFFIAILLGIVLFIYFAIHPITIFNSSSKTFMLGAAGALLGADLVASIKIAISNEYSDVADKLKAALFYFLGGVVLSMAVLGIVAGATAFIAYLFGLLTSPDRNPTYAGIVTSVFVLFIGYLLFLFRLHTRALYGWVELFVGLTVAYAQVQNLKKDAYIFEPTIAMSLLTASVYLIVRAMDNINEGQKSDKLIAIWRKYKTRSNA